jgi:hypothetical protein
MEHQLRVGMYVSYIVVPELISLLPLATKPLSVISRNYQKLLVVRNLTVANEHKSKC